jgi:hypothetical protein
MSNSSVRAAPVCSATIVFAPPPPPAVFALSWGGTSLDRLCSCTWNFANALSRFDISAINGSNVEQFDLTRCLVRCFQVSRVVDLPHTISLSVGKKRTSVATFLSHRTGTSSYPW